MRYLKYIFFLIALPVGSLFAHLPTAESTSAHRKQLQERASPQCVAIPEGGFVYYFHPKVYDWLEKRIDVQTIQTMRKELTPFLQIPLSKEGFTMASTRKAENEIDETNYSAIWVRDACWHYFGLKLGDRDDARKLILNLLEFYASSGQIERFFKIIAFPTLADPTATPNAHMNVPLIRFSRKTLSHHQIDEVDQPWNHLQFDSHGLFLLAISDALRSKILSPEDISLRGYEALACFPAFFSATNYWDRNDVGPWEEELINNASTVGLIAASLRGYQEELLGNPSINEQLKAALDRLQSNVQNSKVVQSISTALSPGHLALLYRQGVARVELNLSLGGEAPNIDGNGIDRRADAALLFLCLPDHALFSGNLEKTQTILNIVLGLVGPYGVFRYKLDAYQALNYWINYEIPSAIKGANTPDSDFITRFQKGYMPSNQPYDAQWFFDSIIAAIYYNLVHMTQDRKIQVYYLTRGDVHLKRAVGQFTGPNAIASNGEALPPFCLPESINTVFDLNYLFCPMPSPICPLGWSTASMRIALEKAEVAHQFLQAEL